MNTNNPDKKTLKFFGVKLSIFLLIFTQFILPIKFKIFVPYSTILPIFTLALVSFLYPDSLAILYRLFKFLEKIVKSLINFIVLTSIFFLIITPLSYLRRILNQEGLDRSFRSTKESYYIPSNESEEDIIERMKFPF